MLMCKGPMQRRLHAGDAHRAILPPYLLEKLGFSASESRTAATPQRERFKFIYEEWKN